MISLILMGNMPNSLILGHWKIQFLDLERSFSPSCCPILPTVAFPQDVAEIMGDMQVGKPGSLQEQSIFAVPDSLRIAVDLQDTTRYSFCLCIFH